MPYNNSRSSVNMGHFVYPYLCPLVCLFVCLSVIGYVLISPKFQYILLMAMAYSSSEVCYDIPVLFLTSCFHIIKTTNTIDGGNGAKFAVPTASCCILHTKFNNFNVTDNENNLL